MKFENIEQEVRGEIMKTDVYIKVFFESGRRDEATQIVQQGFEMFRSFEHNYSRFRKDNVLWHFNESEGGQVPAEFFSMLEFAMKMYRVSDGLFDPAILPILEREGYRGAYQGDYDLSTSHTFGEVQLDRENRLALKPRTLKIDLGGLGKGFIVDQVSVFLRRHFEHTLVDAGGDIMTHGRDCSQDIAGWALGVEDARTKGQDLATILLTNGSIATSGINRRHWTEKFQRKHHLIEPAQKSSASSDLIAVSVIAPTALEADVWAKILFLMGRTRGQDEAKKQGLPALFITRDSVTMNKIFSSYVWKA